MVDDADSKLFALRPLSMDEVARAVSALGHQSLDLPPETIVGEVQHAAGDLPTMTATQRFWLAFAGKPGSSGRAGRAYEPGLPRTGQQSVDVISSGIPHQQGPIE